MNLWPISWGSRHFEGKSDSERRGKLHHAGLRSRGRGCRGREARRKRCPLHSARKCHTFDSEPEGNDERKKRISRTHHKDHPPGFFQRIQLDCGFPLVAYVTRHSLDDLSLDEGKDVDASFKATAIHVVRRKRSDQVQ